MLAISTLRFGIAAVLVVAALSKIVSRTTPRALFEALALPPAVTVLAALTAPVEIVCGLFLLAGPVAWAAVASTVITVAFVVILTAAWRAGVAQGCRCFGALDTERLSPVSVTRAVVLAVASGVLLVAAAAGPEPGFTMTGLGLGLTAATCYIAAFAVLGQVWEFERRRSQIRAALRAREHRTHAAHGRERHEHAVSH
jgi:uncharacterized membrane protein YphA (DoxX/SURF4 family)